MKPVLDTGAGEILTRRRVSLFCDTALAGRIEEAETQLITRCCEAARRRTGAAGFAIPIAGGVASFAGQGSPFNKVAGLGFAGLPGPAALDDIEKAFAACGSPAQVELAVLADPATGALLTGRGYRLESFENVLGRDLTDGFQPVMPPGTEARRSDADELEAWLDVVAEGSVHPDPQGVPWHEEFPREVIIGAERDGIAAGAVRYTGLRGGIIAGGATMRIADGVAQLTGAATAPRTAATGYRPRFCRPGSPMPLPLAATSPSSPPSQDRSPIRTRNARGSTCCIPVPSWSSSHERGDANRGRGR